MALFRETQDAITGALEVLDGGGRFTEDRWERPGGGGGASRVLEDGSIFERAGVNFSEVHGDVPAALDPELKGEGAVFFAAGVSLVLHPKSPHLPTVHANFRLIERGGKELVRRRPRPHPGLPAAGGRRSLPPHAEGGLRPARPGPLPALQGVVR